MELTDCQMEILRLLKVLEVPEEKVIRAMVSVENPQRAEAVIDKLLEMEDNNENLTASKLLEVMATI